MGTKSVLMRFVLGVAVATAGVPAFAATTQDGQGAPDAAIQAPAERPTIAKAVYRRDKGILVISGTGFDDSATIRLNGVELTGERKFKADKGKLRVTLPANTAQFKADGQNRLEVVQNELSSGEFGF